MISEKGYYRRFVTLGIGGWNCQCCGPRPGDKPEYRRIVRSQFKRLTEIELEECLEEMNINNTGNKDSNMNIRTSEENFEDPLLDDIDAAMEEAHMGDTEVDIEDEEEDENEDVDDLSDQSLRIRSVELAIKAAGVGVTVGTGTLIAQSKLIYEFISGDLGDVTEEDEDSEEEAE